MQLAHFQVGRSESGWVIRFEDQDYAQLSRDAAISVATRLAEKVARLGVETIVFVEPVSGESWTEWRPGQPPPERSPLRRSWSGRSRSGEEIPYLRLISSG